MRAYALRHSPAMPDRIGTFLRLGGGRYLGVLFLLLATLGGLYNRTADSRHQIELARPGLEERLNDLDSARWNVSVSEKMLRSSKEIPPPMLRSSYVVISLTDRRLWYKQEEHVLLTAPVATGSGKRLVKERGGSFWKFDTPRGRLFVESKEENPLWVPPDWFYVEHARKKKLALVHLERGRSLAVSDGSVIRVSGNDVIRGYPDGRWHVVQASEEKDIIVDRKLLVPPLDTNQRRFDKVLGTHRLNLGNGYGLHGTNHPETVGHAVSHGCVRLRNDDIARLYQLVPVGTPVYLY